MYRKAGANPNALISSHNFRKTWPKDVIGCEAARGENGVPCAAGRMERRPTERGSAFRRAGLQSERVELAAHFALQSVVDDLVLLHPGFPAKGLGDDGRGVVVAVTGKIANRHLCVWDASPDKSLDIVRSHGHEASSTLFPRMQSRFIRSRHRGKASRPSRQPCGSIPRHRRRVLAAIPECIVDTSALAHRRFMAMTDRRQVAPAI